MSALRLAIGSFFLMTWLLPGGLAAQSAGAPALPFGAGESLVYRVNSVRFGGIGRGEMKVDGIEEVRGVSTYRVEFAMEGRVGPFRIEDRTRSWIDPAGPASLRYEKRERHPLATKTEEVDLYPAEMRWEAADGRSGELLTGVPLDELSFIYLVRMIDLEEDSEVSVTRHYEADRNPVKLRLVGRERLPLPVGVFEVRIIEMQVKDGDRFKGSGLIRLYLTDDSRRYPVRIETTLPVVGKLVLDLEALTPASEIASPESGNPPTENPANSDVDSRPLLTAERSH